jgi:ABC-2 type transport system ATP-binding protein
MVVVRDLKKRFGSIEAVRNVSFEIHPGEIFGVLGPNGAGKTTTIECTLGLTQPDDGTIEICGIDARRHPAAARERVGAALQTTALHDRITPREALNFFGAFYRTAVPADALLERFSLSAKAHASVDTLSGGQRQRLALALAFVNNPAVVLLDEPTAGLDAHSRRELHGEIRNMKRDGHTVLLTTHQLDEADLLCDRLAIINRGAIVATGTPRELVAASSRVQRLTVQANRTIPDSLLEALPESTREKSGAAEQDDRSVTLRTIQPSVTIPALLAVLEAHGISVVELHLQKASLEDVFVDLTTLPAEQIS